MLYSLPDELIVQILEILNASDRNSQCRLVSRRLKNIIDDSPILQVSTECELAGVTLGRLRRAALPDIRASLEERRNVWRTLRGMSEITLPVCDENERILPISGRDCGIICQSTSDNRLVLTQLPSRTRGIPLKTWTLDFGTREREPAGVVADEHQDLLVVAYFTFDDSTGRIFGVELQMLSLATGTAHPAARGIIHLVLPPSYTRDPPSHPATKISLAGGFIGIMVEILRSYRTNNDHICHHWVCNWKTGEITVEAWCGNDRELSNAFTFAFLSTDYVLIARYGWPRYEVELVLVNIRGPSQRGTYAALTGLILNLPGLEPGAHCVHIAINDHSLPLHTSSDHNYAFSSSLESRMIFIDLLYIGSRGLHYAWRLAVPAAHILKCVNTHELNAGEEDRTVVQLGTSEALRIPWPDWEREVRWVEIPRTWSSASYSSTSWLSQETRTPYELRGHRSPFPGHNRSRDFLVRYDFPTSAQMRRESQLPPPPFESLGLLTLVEVNYCKREAVLGDDLWAFQVSSAPYRQTIFTTSLEPDIREYLGYEITEDALLLRDLQEPNNRKPWHVFSI